MPKVHIGYGSCDSYILVLQEIAKFFATVAGPVYILPTASLCPLWYLVLSLSFILTILMGVKWYFIVVFISIYVISVDVEHNLWEYLPTVYPLWWNIWWYFCPFSNLMWYCWVFWVSFKNTYFYMYSFVGYVICRFSLLVYIFSVS